MRRAPETRTPSALVATLLALLAPACGSTGAQAGRLTRVLVVAGGAPHVVDQPERALREHVSDRQDLELRSVNRLATLAARSGDGAGAEALDAAEREARERVTQAEEAFSRFDYDGATTQLSEAIELLRPTAARAAGRQRLAELHVRLAMVRFVHSEREAAIQELRACLHLDPACAPDPARYPPELLSLMPEARSVEGTSSLRVETDPPGAEVSLDGAGPQRAPHEFERVAAGRHTLALSLDGFLPEVHALSVAAGAPTERRFTLTAGTDAQRAGAALRALQSRGPDAAPRWRAEAANLGEADVVVVLGGERTLSLGVFDARGEPVTADAVARGAPPDVALFLDAVLPPPVVPYYGQWWFWTPIVAGVALGLAALTFGVVNVPSVRFVGGTVTAHD